MEGRASILNRETLDRWCERGILGLVLGIVVFSPLAFGAARLQEFLVVQLLTTGVLVLWLARIWLTDRAKFLLPPLSWAILAFAGYALGRYLTCDVEYVGRQEFLRILVYAALFFAILNNLHRQESTQIIGFTLFGIAVVISGYAIYQFATGSDRVWNVHSGYLGRSSGTYICPNHLAGFLEMLLPLAVAYALVGRGKPLTKILISYSALVMVAGIIFTASRGSWIAVSVALLAIVLLLLAQRSFRWAAVGLLALLLIGGSVAATKTEFFKKRFSQAVVGGKVDQTTRLVLWEAAVRMWRDHVWFGVGPGHYDLRFRAYRPASIQLRPERAHNEYLNALADWGVAGCAIIALGLGLLAVGVIKVWKHVQRGDRAFASNTSDKFAFVLGAAAGLFSLALHSVVDFNLQIPANAIIAVTLMALLTSHWRFATDRFWFSARRPAQLGISLALLTAIGYLGWQEVRLGREWLWLMRAAQAEPDSLAQAALLENAYAIEPHNGDTAHAIGEIYRLNSFEGKSGYAELAAQAIAWYQRGITNHPHNSNNYMRWGMVLDFLTRHAEAEAVFLRADELDPNGYFTSAHIGRHYVETGEYAAARPWLERSLRLMWQDNKIAASNLKIANERMLQAAQDPVLQKLRESIRTEN